MPLRKSRHVPRSAMRKTRTIQHAAQYGEDDVARRPRMRGASLRMARRGARTKYTLSLICAYEMQRVRFVAGCFQLRQRWRVFFAYAANMRR